MQLRWAPRQTHARHRYCSWTSREQIQCFWPRRAVNSYRYSLIVSQRPLAGPRAARAFFIAAPEPPPGAQHTREDVRRASACPSLRRCVTSYMLPSSLHGTCLYLLIMSLTSLKNTLDALSTRPRRETPADSYVSAAASSPCCGFGLAWPVGAASARAAGTDATKANS